MKKTFLSTSLNLQQKRQALENKRQDLSKPIASEYFLNLYEQIIQNSRDVLYCINLSEFEIIYISPSIVELSGYSIEELIQMTGNELLQIIHPSDREIVVEHYQSLNSGTGRKNQSVEYRIKPKRGIYRWIDDNHIIIFDPIENSQKIVGNLHDITDLKMVEDALKRSRDRLYMAIEATNDGMWDWRLDTNKIYFDMRFYTMIGYEPNEFPGSFEEWMEHIHPDDKQMVSEKLKLYLKENTGQWHIEYRFLAKDGSWIWVLNRGKVFDRDEQDKPLRMVGTHTDITLRKKAELAIKQKNNELIEAEENLNNANKELIKLNKELNQRNIDLENIYNQLQISEERFRQLAENTEDIFWLRDESKILYINPAFYKIWEQNSDEVIDDPSVLLKWIHPDDWQRFNSWISLDLFESQTSYSEQYRIITPKGETK